MRPARDEPLDVGEWDTIVPSDAVELVRKTSKGQLILEELEICVGNVQLKRLLLASRHLEWDVGRVQHGARECTYFWASCTN